MLLKKRKVLNDMEQKDNIPKNPPLVYVLTLNWNGKQITIDCVGSVLKSDYPIFKVVVIDNGSTDGSAQALKEKFGNRIAVLENTTNLGYAQGFNTGLKYGLEKNNGDYCLIMNNDTIIDPKAISELVKIAETNREIGFVSGKVYFYDSPNILQTVGKKWHSILWSGPHIGANERDIGRYKKIEERDFLDDIFTLVPRKLYKDTKGYDPQFFLQGEEFDWQIRAKKLGWKLYYTPYAKLWHKGSASMGGLGSPISVYFYIRNHTIAIFNHGNLIQCFRIWIYFFGNTLFALIKSFLKILLGRKSRLSSHLAGLLGWMSATLWIIYRRPARKVPWFIRLLSA